MKPHLKLALLTIAFLLGGCCQSRWCQLEMSLRSLPEDKVKSELARLNDEDLLDFVAWKVDHTHPPGFHYPFSVFNERAGTIVKAMAARLNKHGHSLVEMEYVIILGEIQVSSPQSFSTADLQVVNRECRAMFPSLTDRTGAIHDSCSSFGGR